MQQLQSQIANRKSQIPAVTWRSVLLGTLAVVAVCGLTPLNDFVFSDTSLAAGYMPLAAVLVLFCLVVVINAPLSRWAPRYALGGGELAVIVLMTLVACSIPNWGLMRFFIPTPVAPFHIGASDEAFWRAFTGMNLPHWLFPVSDIRGGRTDPVAVWFYSRVPRGEHIPYSAWVVPLLAWGIFAAAMLATFASVARLVLDQWITNERLPFPLVQVQAELIEPPAPRRAFNDLVRSRLLWIGLFAVLLIQLLSCLNAYFPRHFPVIPLRYDLTNILSEEPFVYLHPKLKRAMLSFTVVGVTYFIRSRTAFSLWCAFIIVNLVHVQQGMMQTELPSAAWADQHLGACVAFIAGILWVGRHHWARILKNALGLGRDRQYRVAFWIAVGGTLTMLIWLCALGVQLWMAALIVVIILAGHVIVARVVAETGLPFYRTSIAPGQIYTNLPPRWFGGRDIYFASVFTVLGSITTRDALLTFTTTGLGVARSAGVTPEQDERQARPGRGNWFKLGVLIAWSLLIGSIVAAAMTLRCQYSYPTPAAADANPARNYFGAEYVPKRDVATAVDDFARGRFTPKPHSPLLHMSIGLGVTLFLQFASLRWASWPLLPVGYVASYGAFLENAWFSIFVGWLAKVLIVRFGGASLFERARPLFVGLIFGEGLAAGIWLIINAILVLNGGDSQSVRFLL